VPTPKIRLDVWDCVESFGIPMFLACRLKITYTSNPKLIISVLIPILLLPSFKLLSLVASTRHAALNLACLLEVSQQAWCTSVYSQRGSGDVILERRFLLSKHFCHSLHNKMHVCCHSRCPIFCSLGVIDFILNPYFGHWCWYHPIQGLLHSIHVEYTH
jgi:hypothetical protein